MQLHDLAPKKARVSRKRKGQGNASGSGTYAGRGMNGQNSRAGGGVRLGFEGGQTPLIRRMPKNPGFTSPNRIEAQVVSLQSVATKFDDGAVVNLESLLEKKLIDKNNAKVKILLGRQEVKLDKKFNIGAEILLSASAKSAVEKAGGQVG